MKARVRMRVAVKGEGEGRVGVRVRVRGGCVEGAWRVRGGSMEGARKVHGRFEAVLTEDVVLADAAHLDVVLARGGERHRVDVVRGVVDEGKPGRVAEDLE